MACPSDNEVAELVQGRLAADAQQETYLHIDSCEDCRSLIAEYTRLTVTGQETNSDDIETALGSLLPGDVIGRYTIDELLGQGGVGEVHSAYDSELERTVALKFLNYREQAPSAQQRKRLAREARALARLSHPNVVAVYEFGHHGGRDYVAMEYVQGVTLDLWLTRDERSRASILETLLAAGRGLSAAHKAGLVHRDFKPSNILVGDDGRVRVSDFGLAHLGDERQWQGSGKLESNPVEDLTQTDTIVGTPAYMPPEQFLGQKTDGKSDQWAFAATLYEALVGRSAFSGNTVKERADSVLHDAPHETSTLPRGLKRILKRALKRNADNRFPDLDSMLLAIERTQRLPRRRVLVTAAVVGTALAVWFARGALQPPSQPCGNSGVALAAAWNAHQKSQLLRSIPNTEIANRIAGDLDRYAKAWTLGHTQVCEATHVHGTQSDSLLDQRMACFDRDLDAFGALISGLVRQDTEWSPVVLAGVVGKLPNASSVQQCQSMPASNKLPMPRDARKREQIDEAFALLAEAEASHKLSRFAESQSLLDSLEPSLEALSYSPLTAQVNFLQATLASAKARTDEAQRYLEKTLVSAAVAKDDKLVAQAYVDLYSIQVTLQSEPSKISIAEERADLAILRVSSPHLTIGLLLVKTSAALAKGDYVEALQHAEHAWSLADDHYAPEDRSRVAPLGLLASSRGVNGDFDGSIAALQIALAVAGSSYGPNDPEKAKLQIRLAVSNIRKGNYSDGLMHGLEGLEMESRVFPDDHDRLAYSRNVVAVAYQELGNTYAAMEMLEKAISAYESNPNKNQTTFSSFFGNLARAQVDLEDYPGARKSLTRGFQLVVNLHGEKHPEVATFLSSLGELAHAEGNYDEARDWHLRSIETRVAVAGPSNPRLGQAYLGLGRAELAAGRLQSALRGSEKALELLLTNHGKEHPVTVAARGLVASVCVEMGLVDRAIAMLEPAIDFMIGHFGPDYVDVGDMSYHLGRAFLRRKDMQLAIPQFERAIAVCSAQPGCEQGVLSHAKLDLNIAIQSEQARNSP